MARRRHAEIAGAGLGGLTLATALAQRGWSVRVHERAPHLRDIGVGTSIWENGHRALDAVGVLDAVKRAGTRIARADLLDHHSRVLRVQHYNETDNRGLVVLRVDHHRALVEAAQKAGVDIVTSSPAKAAQPEGVLVLESGERLDADLVVGCDGYHSKVRELLGLTAEIGFVTEAYTGRFTVPRDTQPEFEITQNWWAGDRRLGLLGCRDVNYVYLCAPEHCSRNPEEVRTKSFNKKVWTQAFPQFEETLRRATSEVVWNRYSNVRCHAWSVGRAAILGDSAHAMPPLLAQGAGCAMANAVSLAAALDGDDEIPSALRGWEQRERAVTDVTQRWAVLSLVLCKRWPSSLLDMRSEMMFEAYSSPGLMAHYLSATRHAARIPAYVADVAGSAA